MADIIQDLILFFGLNASPATFADFFPWFFVAVMGMELVRFVFIMIFSLIRGLCTKPRKGGE